MDKMFNGKNDDSEQKLFRQERKNSDKITNTINLPKSPRSSGVDLSNLKRIKKNDDSNLEIPDESDDDDDNVSEKSRESELEKDNIISVGEVVVNDLDILFPELASSNNNEKGNTKFEDRRKKEKENKLILERRWKNGLSRFPPISKLQKQLEKNNYQVVSQICYVNKDKKNICMLKLISPLGDYFFSYLNSDNDLKFHETDILLEDAKQRKRISSSFKNGILSNLPQTCIGTVFISDSYYCIMLSKGLTEKNLVIKGFKGDVDEEYTYPYPLVHIKEILSEPMSIAGDISYFSIKNEKDIQVIRKDDIEEVDEMIDQLKEAFLIFSEKQEECFEEIKKSKMMIKNNLDTVLKENQKNGTPLEDLNFGAIIYNISQRSELEIRLSRNLEMVANLSRNINEMKNNLESLNRYLKEEYINFDKIMEPDESE